MDQRPPSPPVPSLLPGPLRVPDAIPAAGEGNYGVASKQTEARREEEKKHISVYVHVNVWLCRVYATRVRACARCVV